jgi:hypothetical protein
MKAPMQIDAMRRVVASAPAKKTAALAIGDEVRTKSRSVGDGDLFPSRKDIALAREAASVGDPTSRLGLRLAISALPCFRASALRQFFDQHTIISFEQE